MTAPPELNQATLRQLLRLEPLAGHEITPGVFDWDQPVRDVVVAQSVGTATIPSQSLVVAALRRNSGYEAELLLRQAHTCDAVAVILTGASRLLLSTRRLAEHLAMPLLTLPGGDPVHLAWQLSRHVHEPERFAATLVPRMLRRLRGPVNSLDDLVRVVRTELEASVAVLGADNAVVAGELPEEVPSALRERPVAQSADTADGHFLCAPVFVEDSRRADLWLAAHIPRSHSYWVEASLQSLSVASLALAAWTARERLTGERDARDRSALLSELMDSAPALPRHVAERAIRAGWRLDGWHVGIHIRALGEHLPLVRLTPAIHDTLHAHGLDGPLVERTDGWYCWVTDDREPPTTSHWEMADRVRQAIDDVAGNVNVVAGVGRPYAGPGGIVTSLGEARDACLFAGTGRRRGRVEHVDELGVRRVLAHWHRSEAFQSYARSLLAPLLDAGEEQLLETLRHYLELESSASSTAAALRVHRNTVAYRINRIEQMLSMNLARSDERLVLQLACRVLEGSGIDPE